jgi:hypothetical protein
MDRLQPRSQFETDVPTWGDVVAKTGKATKQLYVILRELAGELAGRVTNMI